MLADAKVANPVVLTGDMHKACAFELRRGGGVVGAEFLSTSISSGGDGVARLANEDIVLGANPHMKLISNRRGYTLHTVTPKEWRADYRALERISVAGAPVTTLRSFVVEKGKPGLADA